MAKFGDCRTFLRQCGEALILADTGGVFAAKIESAAGAPAEELTTLPRKSGDDHG